MSKSNPRKAGAAFLPAPIPIPGTGETVQPFSLATYGILEKIGSPLVVPAQGSVTALDLIPSLYVVTHDAEEVLAGDIAADSVAWAKTLPPPALLPIEEAARRQIGAVIDVLPESAKKKSREGDGWIAEFAGWACEAYGWSWREVAFEVPAAALALLRRQWLRGRGEEFFLLSEIEAIDGRQRHPDKGHPRR